MTTGFTPAVQSYSVVPNTDGTIDMVVKLGPASVNAQGINWSGLLQLLVTYGPSMMSALSALLAIFASPSPAPAPTPVPAPTPSPTTTIH